MCRFIFHLDGHTEPEVLGVTFESDCILGIAWSFGIISYSLYPLALAFAG